MTQNIKNFLYDKNGVFKLALLSSPLFIFGLVVKLYAATLFAGSNFTELFAPFLKYFILNGGESPYTYFFNIGILEAFPYPQLMLFVLSFFGVLFAPFVSLDIFSITHGELLLFHLPIIVADITILIVLSRWLKNKHTELLWLYWLSPILFYINYLHSQLDAIPIALTFVFLYFLFKERWWYASAFLGAAIATKFHIVIILPFTIAYLWRRKLTKTALSLSVLLVGFVFALINNVQLFSKEFLTIVFSNREQGKIFDLQINFGEHVLYIIPFAYTVLFIHALTFNRMNRDTFVMFLGFCFGILTLGIPPMQGWYYWIIPFFIYFYVKNDQFSKIPFVILCISYFIYFALIPDSDYLLIFSTLAPSIAALPNLYEVMTSFGIDAAVVSNIALSLLQASLFMNVVWLYRRGVEESKKQKLYNMPYLIGIAGDSGSGKSTLTDLFVELFGDKHVALMPGDAMHKWERGHSMWSKYTHLDPRANQLHSDISHIRTLQNGEDTYRRHYDHHTGTFVSPDKLESKTVVVFEGLHSFFLTEMQQALDLKIFIKPDDQLRCHWKVKRDMAERGYTKEKVLAQLKAREHDASEYISVQEKYADIVFSLKSLLPIPEERLGTQIDVPVYLEITCDNKVYLEPFIDALSRYVNIEHTFTDKQQILSLTGTISEAVLEYISYSLTPDLYDIIIDKPKWTSNHRGLMQLFVTYYMLQTLNYNRQQSQPKVEQKNTSLTDLVRSARIIGTDKAYVQGGGGNVSIKINDNTMAVKASGLRLEELQETSGFVGIDYGVVRRFFNNPQHSLQNNEELSSSYNDLITEGKRDLPNVPDTQLRPSIETGFHAILDTVVLHTHSVYVNILTCSVEGKHILATLFPSAAFIPYYTPGTSLTFAVSKALKERPYDTFFLENHGVIVSGKTVSAVHTTHTEINNVIKKFLKRTADFPNTVITTDASGRLVSNHPSLTQFIRTHGALLTTLQDTILFPDQVVYCTRFGFAGDGQPITIDLTTGEVSYDVSYKEALAFIETLIAWLYIEVGIQNNKFTHKLIPATEGHFIASLDSEKYRKKLIS